MTCDDRHHRPRKALVRVRLVSRAVRLIAGCALAVFLAAPARANPVSLENALPGNPASEWDVAGAGDASIQGFATEMSVDQGETVYFKVDTDATDYRIDIYRIGYYGGMGARKVATIQPSAALPQVQPAPLSDPATGLVDCGNWAVSASWAVPAAAVSGVYVARLVREDPDDGRASHVLFVVRDDDGGSDLLFQTNDATWQAYNTYGGNSLYLGSPAGRAYKVSYNRPLTTRCCGCCNGSILSGFFSAPYPMVRWLEANGFDVSYTSCADSDRRGAEILEHRVFLSVGHDEYWSAGQRASVEAARDSGVHLAFFSGNEVFWKTRWEPSLDGPATPYRTLVCYKETHANAKIDPLPGVWTGTWRDPRFSPPADGGRPENALMGTIFTVNGDRSDAISVPEPDGKMRFWRNTSIATLAPGQSVTFDPGTLGFEWDEDLDNGARPPGLFRLSTSTVNGVPLLQDHGSTYASGTATHHMTTYRHASGALVFSAGTVQWSWGLDATHDVSGPPADLRMQQATINLFADMDVQPATLQPGLTAATASTDAAPPLSAIGAPAPGTPIPSGTPVTISGTASDVGGRVGGVEISVDGGVSWHPAAGRESWTYEWTPGAAGAVTLRARSADDSGNLESPGDTVTVVVGPPASPICPCTLFSGPGGPGVNDPQAVELGVRFRSDRDGFIQGVRFYKPGLSNGGVHVGKLWSNTGTLLASATFSGETASGWQEVSFGPGAEVAITAGTLYVASVFMPQGNYAATNHYFASAGVARPPLHAPRDGEGGFANGVYLYGSGGFPVNTYLSTNYWVDVVFDTAASGPDTTGPVVTITSPANGASGVAVSGAVTATFNEGVLPSTVNGSTVKLAGPGATPVSGAVTYDAPSRTVTFTPAAALAHSTLYQATLSGGGVDPVIRDLAGNALAADVSWSFTTAAPPPPPPTEGPGGPILVVSAASNPFSRYPVEILRAEGLNAFTAMDLSLVTADTLAGHDVVVLGEVPLAPAQVAMLSDWVQAGGTLIAFRPDADLAPLLGLTPAGGTLSDQYLLVNTASAPGAGIVGETIQFHGAADLYTLNGATPIATLYSNPSTPTAHPAVTLRGVGSAGGKAIAFTYDLARSVVYTRQGNPAWAGQKRDGEIPPIRSDDQFFGNAWFDPQPDWVNLDKVAIPQADEQQRLLANLILLGNLHRKPLPRFWYFPRGLKAAIVETGDNHGASGMAPRFDIYRNASAPACSAPDWECVRGTGYLYVGSGFTDAQARFYHNLGFEVALHVNTGCANFTRAQYRNFISSQLAAFRSAYPSVPAPTTNRNHCIAWSEWSMTAEVQAEFGIRLDTNYYYWPPGWVQNRAGMFTGSGIPMRFAKLDGTIVDCYQAATQMPDESGLAFPAFCDQLLDRALGPEGYYGAFTTNMHFDQSNHAGSNAIVASAQARGVPVVSAKQLLEWLDGRNGSSFGSLAWNANRLSFTIAVGEGARNLRAMLPTNASSGSLSGLTRDGDPVPWTVETIKGIEYAFFPAGAGAWIADYSPVLSATDARPAATALRSVVPNPVVSGATIVYAIGADDARGGRAAVSLAVCDLQGRVVRRLEQGVRHAGLHHLLWDGRDDRGRRLQPGVYFCRLRAGAVERRRALVMLQ